MKTAKNSVKYRAKIDILISYYLIGFYRGYWSPEMKQSSGLSPTTGLMAFLLWNTVTHSKATLSGSFDRLLTNMARKRRFGGGGGHTTGGFRNVLFLLILIAIVPLIILVLTGPNTGNAGIYGNVTVSNTMRNSAATFASFFVVFVILIVVKGLEFLGL